MLAYDVRNVNFDHSESINTIILLIVGLLITLGMVQVNRFFKILQTCTNVFENRCNCDFLLLKFR